MRFPWKWKKRVEPKATAPTKGDHVEVLGPGAVLITTEHFAKQEGSHVPGNETEY